MAGKETEAGYSSNIQPVETGETSRSREASVLRETRETSINISLNLDGTGQADIETGIGFLDHMLEQIARHGLFDLSIKAKGDLHIDPGCY